MADMGEPLHVWMPIAYDRAKLVSTGGDFTVRVQCDQPAPLVVNGGHYAGCALDQGHEGQHSITIKWGR
jgi:hypothetical protein